MPASMALIELNQVSRTYRLGKSEVAALCCVDLQIDAGEFVAIWGPSGSGKTTLCNLFGAIDTPTSGTVIVNGKDISELSDNELSEHRNHSLGFIFQNFNLVPVFSAVENVALPLLLRGEERKVARTAATELLSSLGLGQHVDHRPDNLSGGQRQRVAIARALVTHPPLVIADEPTANLDSENARSIVELMRHVNETRGTTFIFATHDQRLLAQVNRRIELRDGAVAEDTRSKP
jgi:putative ABC transport system ATP-binding protein